MRLISLLLRYAVTLIIAESGLMWSCECWNFKKAVKNDSSLSVEAKKFMNELNVKYERWLHKKAIQAWNSAYLFEYQNTSSNSNSLSKMHEYNGESHAKIVVEGMTHDDIENDETYLKNTYRSIIKFPWNNITDYDTYRQLEKFYKTFRIYLTKLKYSNNAGAIAKMEEIYATTKICSFSKPTQCDLSLQPEITEVMMTSRNPMELKHTWKSWHDATGEKVKKYYIKYVKSAKKIARMNDYKDMSAMWLNNYETNKFMSIIDSLWTKIKPLYKQLYSYVRRHLRHKYGYEIVSKKGAIPAHLFGNMWAQTWIHIAEFTMPYPEKKLPDVTHTMIEQKWNKTKIFTVAESFFTSLGLSPMPELFWNRSILEKPKDRDIMCHPAAWDFFDRKDFRIIQCTSINMENLLTAYHEMGHIEYYIQYKDQPSIYKCGANAGFHEAIGDTISLSAETPDNFHKIGLLHHDTHDYKAIINHLYMSALEKIAFLPYAYTLEKWRFDVFQSKISPDNYNYHWWYLNNKYRGMVPPVERSNLSFDPGAKYHVIADVEYLRYFISYIIQFQFHKALCTEAEMYDPKDPEHKILSKCNIRGSHKAGQLLRSMLKMGSSRPWPDAMEKITGQRKMDAGPILEYFMPLKKWLESDNAKHGEFIGWKQKNRLNIYG